MNTLNEIFTDLEDRLDNIEAIKGKPFRHAVEFAMQMRSITLFTSIVAQEAAEDKEQYEQLRETHAIMIANTMRHVLRFCMALSEDDSREVMKLATSIGESTEEHMKASEELE